MPFDVSRLRAAYRTDSDIRADEIERYFVIAEADSQPGLLEATLVVPVRGIQRQLLELHQKARGSSFESKLVQVSVRRFTVNAKAYPAIDSRMDGLALLNLSMRDDEMIRLDPEIHRILLSTPYGTIDARIVDNEYPLVRWAAGFHDALMRCAPK